MPMLWSLDVLKWLARWRSADADSRHGLADSALILGLVALVYAVVLAGV